MKREYIDYILKNIDTKGVKEISSALNIKERKIKRFLAENNKDVNANAQTKNRSNPQLKTIIHIILIALCIIAAYSNALDGGFIWDDEYLVQSNAYIKDWSNIEKVFTEDFGTGAGIKYGFYRPLQLFTYMIDYSIGGLDVSIYHVTNIFLHIFAAILLYFLIKKIFPVYDRRFRTE